MIKSVTSFLFDNKSVKQTVMKNTFWITLSSGICKALRAVLIIYVARALGPSGYGKFAFALAFVSLFVSFFDMGIPTIVTRDFSKKEASKEEFDSLVSLRVVLGILTITSTLILSLFVTEVPEIRELMWILIVASFLGQFPEIFYSLFRSKERMEYESFINVFQVILLCLIVFIVVSNFLSPRNISYSYLFANLVALISVFIFFYRKYVPFKFSVDFKVWKKFLIAGWPLALTSIFAMIYGYFDSTFLGFTNRVADNGLYNAALRIINIIVLPSGIISMTFYPVLSRFSADKTAFQKVFNFQMKAMAVLAVFFIAISIFFARNIILFIYGESYLSAVSTFQILLATAFITYFFGAFSQVFIILKKQWKYFWTIFWGSLLNVVLDIVLIPSLSLYGAAVASLTATLFMLILAVFLIYRDTFVKPFDFLKMNSLFSKETI